ncbi:DMT family transporter [Rhodocyclus tenuis]|uniref:Drug/metabolite transporter (DMT)-like permease n=1 Tax=Rhodocyclus tenuis TaxID=1066 RepID=A0A840G9C8_RHOTE|nr:EamA family transporter [Rhodocyclus tenuis]MBB4248465.1 drug/metabolite transporter (DMT)-like permease [Rhodocyclus tenuis]
MHARNRWLPALALFVLTLTWGYTWIVAKQGLVHAPPLAFAAERCVGGALALFVILKLLGRPLGLVAAGPTLAIGLSQVTAFMIFQTWALVEGGPGKTAVLIYTMPIWTLLLAWPILGERLRGKQWLAAASTLIGLVLIIEPWNLHASLFSDILGLLGALSWAVGTILIKRLRSTTPVDLLNLTAWQMLLGAIPLVLLTGIVPERPTEWTLGYLGIIAFMSIVSTALCWLLWIYILDRVPAWEASLSVLGTPVVAILSSRLIFGETFSLSELSGIVLIGGGLVFLSLLGWAASRRSPVKAPARPEAA